jgi:hypothetical protein
LNPVSSLSKNISPTIPLHSSPGVAHSQDGIHCESNSSGDIYLQPREDKRFDQGKLHIMADNCRKQELEKKNVNDKNISVSFYAKTSHSNYSDVAVYLARYNGTTLLEYKVIGTATLTTNWSRYDFTTFINTVSAGAALNNDYCEVGIDLIPLITQANEASVSLSTDVHVSLASFNAASGISSIKHHSFQPYGQQLQYCQQYYYSTYARDERIGTPTLSSTFISSETTPYLVTIPNYASAVHELPIHMRITPTISIYSPYSGSSNEGYNQSAQRELRYTNGTVGYNSAIRSADGSIAISATPRINNIKINLLNGYVPYDQVYYHFIADADYPI